jgi:hypothetical protein
MKSLLGKEPTGSSSSSIKAESSAALGKKGINVILLSVVSLVLRLPHIKHSPRGRSIGGHTAHTASSHQYKHVKDQFGSGTAVNRKK